MINIIVIINMLSSCFQSAINGNFALKIKKNPRVNEMFLFSLFFYSNVSHARRGQMVVRLANVRDGGDQIDGCHGNRMPDVIVYITGLMALF